MFLVFSLTILEPITTEGTHKRLTSFASCIISEAVCDADNLPHMSFSLICMKTKSDLNFFTMWRSKCLNDFTFLPPTP